ncbi:MAG: DNA polymerase I [Eubacteriales bacterium]|nr:DNA polymerase I [Bacillota bacterium]MBV1726940.1 DNA polymerase I [Desulforudis sp.]MDQ7788943.1 DNA polymerase I [Clostridia bacterium]MDZ4044051.1 DNA polymerase I [Eubacteriales bacterium]MBU4533984.1 DNA polymerase I [Bacillota bacterium]
MAKMMVIDGNSLVHRAFHAIQSLSTTGGLPTNAVYGFTSMLFKALADQKPDIVIVAFDKGRITFRHDAYSQYKAHRPETAEELRPQFPLVKEVLQALRIPVLELENYEADDIIGTLVNIAEEAGHRSLIVSGDQDVLQLVSPCTSVLITRKGISQLEVFGEQQVLDKFGLGPDRLIDMKGLVGDPSDNIPGVPGIGVKTAAKLLGTYGTVEHLLRCKDELPLRLKGQLETYHDQALLSKQLATIERSVPGLTAEVLKPWPGPDRNALVEIFRKIEFRSLLNTALSLFPEEPKPLQAGNATEVEVQALSIHSAAEGEHLLSAARKANIVAITSYGDRYRGSITAAITIEDRTYLLDPAREEPAASVLRELISEPGIPKAVHNAKELMWVFHSRAPFDGLAFDTMIAAYLTNPTAASQELKDVALDRLGVVLPEGDREALLAGSQCTAQLVPVLKAALAEQEQEALFYDVELPLVEVLAVMEVTGIVVDRDQLARMSSEFGDRMVELAEEIYTLAGEQFNINSPRQLGQILFEKLGLPKGKKTKTGYSTDAGVLFDLAESHEIVQRILEYRQLIKLKGTYTDGLAALVDQKTSRLHTTLHQAVTATGRLSSAEPNLQNIPIRLELGRRIRRVFIPSSADHVLLAADYSQIELRIMAHLSGDPALISAFRENQDIHRRTASEVFGIPLDEVTPDLRGRAKAVNFGIIYGISDFGLARDLRIPRREAKDYIDRYFQRLPGVKRFIDQTIHRARERGFVTTVLNRRRPMPELFSPNRNVRNFGERAAVNTPIQGSAADIIKLAMVSIYRAMKERGLQSRLILQVHDELIFDVPKAELEAMTQLVRSEMEGGLELAVPLTVDIKIGPNWYDVKKIPR